MAAASFGSIVEELLGLAGSVVGTMLPTLLWAGVGVAATEEAAVEVVVGVPEIVLVVACVVGVLPWGSQTKPEVDATRVSWFSMVDGEGEAAEDGEATDGRKATEEETPTMPEESKSSSDGAARFMFVVAVGRSPQAMVVPSRARTRAVMIIVLRMPVETTVSAVQSNNESNREQKNLVTYWESLVVVCVVWSGRKEQRLQEILILHTRRSRSFPIKCKRGLFARFLRLVCHMTGLRRRQCISVET